MSIERIKTILLTFLVCTSVILTYQMWFDDRLWQNGNPIVQMLNEEFFSIFKTKETVYSMPRENLSRPARIVATRGTEKFVYYNSDKDFDRLFAEVKRLLVALFENDDPDLKRSTSSLEEWYALFGENVLYVDYALEYTPQLLAAILGVENVKLTTDFKAIKDFIIVPLDSETECVVLWRDGDAIEKILLNFEEAAALSAIVDSQLSSEREGYLFSFELDFDKLSENEAQSAIISPMALIAPEEVETPVIRSVKPQFNKETEEQLLACFNYRPNLIVDYVGANNTKNFIDTYSTLKIHENAVLEYTALDAEHGLRLTEVRTLYEALNKTIELTENVWRACFKDMPLNLRVTSDILENPQGEYLITLDYFFAGLPITIALDGEQRMEHAVEIQIEDGIVRKYKFYLRNFEELYRKKKNTRMLIGLGEALGPPVAGQQPVYVEDIFLSYMESGEGVENEAQWVVK